MEPVDYRRAMEILAADGLEFVRPEEGVLLAWSRDGRRLLWTSPAGAYLRPLLTIDAAGRTDPALPLEERLRALGMKLSPSQGLRMERLRLSAGRSTAQVTCACRLVGTGSEAVLLTAIVGPIPSLSPRARGALEEPTESFDRPHQPVASIAPAEPERGIEARLKSLREGGRQRFVWQADAHGHFTFVSDTLADVVGTTNADILGCGWDAIAGTVVEDPSGEVSGLFARHETWSGREILWRIDQSNFAVPVDLAGIPAIGANREILGFRGFGVCRTDAIREVGKAAPPMIETLPDREPEAASAPDGESRSNVAAEPIPAVPTERSEPFLRRETSEAARPQPGERDVHEAAPEVVPLAAEPVAASPIIVPASRRLKRNCSAAGFGYLSADVHARIGLPRPTPLRDPHRGVVETVRDVLISGPERASGRREEGGSRLSSAERKAFRDIARALSMGLERAPPGEPALIPAATRPPASSTSPIAADAGASVRFRELSAILDTVSDGVIVLDGAARIVSLNRSAEALFGLDQAEVAGERLTTLFAPDSRAAVLDYVAGLGRSGVGGALNDGRDLIGRVREGGTFPLSMTIGRIGGEADQRFCAVLRDVSATKSMERELVAAREAVDDNAARNADLLAKISHEIRTPLNTVLGFSEIMREERFGPLGNERYREYVHDVHEAAGQVFALVNNLLDLARIEAGRMELTFTGVSLNEVVTGCVSSLQVQAARARIVLRTSFVSHLPPVVADARSVREIVLNLLSNALAFTPAGGQIIVSTALSDRGELVFRVRDTGIGMTREEIEAALQPFRKVSPRGGGSGLGLPLTKALVEANRGELQITSTPREGTLVEVVFPSSRVLAN